MKISNKDVRRAVHKALRQWYEPTRAGMDLFVQMKLPGEYGFSKKASIIENRLSINRMLTFYIDQLGKLRPDLAEILYRRFEKQQGVKRVAYLMSKSIDYINQLQSQAITYLSGLIYDDEERRRKGW